MQTHKPFARSRERASVRRDEGPHGSTHFITKTLPKIAAEMAISFWTDTGDKHRPDQASDRRDRDLNLASLLAAGIDIPKGRFYTAETQSRL